MSKDVAIMGLGAWVGILPFLGFPSTWDVWILVVSGILLIIAGIIVRRGDRTHRRRKRHTVQTTQQEFPPSAPAPDAHYETH